jgi:signal transduction histidine kinase
MASAQSGDDETLADERLVLLDRLRQAERQAVSSRVASVIGHLIGTPLNVIAGRAALIRANPHDESTIENARRIEEQVDRLAQRIRRLIEYLTAPDQAVAPRSVSEVLDDAVSLYRPIAEQRGVRFEEPEPPLPNVQVDSTSGLIVLTSLLSLAVRAATAGAAVRIGVASAENGVRFELAVPGMEAPQERIDRLEPPEHGWRGSVDQLQVLSVSYAISWRSGGRLEIQPLDAAQGTLIRLFCKSV